MRTNITLIMILALTGMAGCGGDGVSTGSSASSDSGTTTAAGDASIALAITAPSSASISSSSGLMKGVARSSALIDTTPATGTTVIAENTGGVTLSNVTCTDTDADGKSTCTGLTEAQLDAGVIFVADTGDMFIRSYVQIPTDTTLANVAAATVPTADVTSATDFALAATEAAVIEAGGTMASPGDIDVPQLNTANIAVSEKSTDETESSNQGSIAAALLAHRTAMIAGADAADETRTALGGDTTDIVAEVGETVGATKVSVDDSFANMKDFSAKLVDTYCTKATDGTTPLTDVADTASAGSVDLRKAFFAAIGTMATMTPTESSTVPASHFQNYITGLASTTQAKTAMATFADNITALKTYKEQMLQGGFSKAANAGAAFGFTMASFPMATAGDLSTINTTKMKIFDFESAARAVFNTQQTYFAQAAANNIDSADTLFTKWNTILSDSNTQRSCASGGANSIGTAVKNYLGGGVFDAASIVSNMLKPPGASCTSDAKCTYNSRCISSVCTSLSLTDGSECKVTSDCAATELCMGGVGKRYCMSAGGIPNGSPVWSSSTATSPVFWGGTGATDIVINSGTDGLVCSNQSGSKLNCASGYTCSGVAGVGGSNGMCYKASGSTQLKFGPGVPCINGNSDCYSNYCNSGGVCAFNSTTYAAWTAGTTSSGGTGSAPREAGFTCTIPRDCLSYNCSAGYCASESISSTLFGTATASLKANGSSCTTSSQCASWFCDSGGVCKSYGGENTTTSGSTTTAAAGTVASGGTCSSTYECKSGLTCWDTMCGSGVSYTGNYTGTTFGTGTTTTPTTTTTTTTTPTVTTLAVGAACTAGSTTNICPTTPLANCVGSPSTCKTVLSDGATCTTGSTTSTCSSTSSCLSGTCQANLLANGQSCTTSNQCTSNFCNLGLCAAASPYQHNWNITTATNFQPPLTVGPTVVTVNCTGNPGPCTIGGLSGTNTVKISQFNSGASTCQMSAGTTTNPPLCQSCTLGGPKTGAAGTTITAACNGGVGGLTNGSIILTAP